MRLLYVFIYIVPVFLLSYDIITIFNIWQANHFGYYNYQVDESELDKHDIDFLSSGICATDSMGNYGFKVYLTNDVRKTL